jgi:hypothetical protein
VKKLKTAVNGRETYFPNITCGHERVASMELSSALGGGALDG